MKTRLRHGFTSSLLALAASAMCFFPSYAETKGTLNPETSPAISGWAMDTENPDTPVSVILCLYTDGSTESAELAKVTADQHRNDDTETEGNGHAFSYTVDWNALEGTEFVIEAYVETEDGKDKLDGMLSYKKETVIPPIPGSGEADNSDADSGQEEAQANESAAAEPAKADASQDTKKSPAASGPATEIAGTYSGASGKKGAYLGQFTATAYCNCSECCSGGFSLTYSGTVPKENHTISADISRYPIGTKLMINDIIYTVEDIGGSIAGNRLDIYFDSHREALNYGRQTVDVYAVQ